MSVPNIRAIWNRVRPSARRVSAKRAPISGKVGSGLVYIKFPAPSESCRMFDTETNFAAQGFIGGLPPIPEPPSLLRFPGAVLGHQVGKTLCEAHLSPASAGLFF